MIQYLKSKSKCAIGVLLAIGPFLLGIVSLYCSLDPPFREVAIWLMALGFLVAVLNFYLSYIRPALLRLRGNTDFKSVSGFPCIGTIAICFSLLLGFGDNYISIAALTALAIDTAGIPWFVFCTWNDKGMWGKCAP